MYGYIPDLSVSCKKCGATPVVPTSDKLCGSCFAEKMQEEREQNEKADEEKQIRIIAEAIRRALKK